jgi:hypothetical protein
LGEELVHLEVEEEEEDENEAAEDADAKQEAGPAR